MSVITKVSNSNKIYNSRVTAKTPNNYFATFWARYMDYAEGKEGDRMLWYMKSIMVVPTVVMVPFIFLMATATPNYVWFVGLCVLLFFANVVVHMAEMAGKIFVPVYQISIAVMVLIPVVAYLLSL